MSRIKPDKTKNPHYEVGGLFRVSGYHTGDFEGRCVHSGWDTSRFRVAKSARIETGAEVEIPHALCTIERVMVDGLPQ